MDGLDTVGVGTDGLATVGVGRDGLGTVGVGSDGLGTVGVGTVGVGGDGVLTGGAGSGTEGVVTGGLTGVEGTVSPGTVSAALAWSVLGASPRSVRTSANRLNPSPQRTPRRNQPPDPWRCLLAACHPLIAAVIYPTLRNSNPPRTRLFEARFGIRGG